MVPALHHGARAQISDRRRPESSTLVHLLCRTGSLFGVTARAAVVFPAEHHFAQLRLQRPRGEGELPMHPVSYQPCDVSRMLSFEHSPMLSAEHRVWRGWRGLSHQRAACAPLYPCRPCFRRRARAGACSNYVGDAEVNL